MLLELTTYAYFSTAPLSTPGASSAAQYVEQEVENALRNLRDTQSFGQGANAAFESLSNLETECKDANWDGYGAAPIDQETFRQALNVLAALPLGLQQPSVGAEPDGHVTLEWYRSPWRTLSVSVSPEGDLHYSALLGPNKAYGTEAFFGEVPKTILDLVNRVVTA
jgi:hypothetical protein